MNKQDQDSQTRNENAQESLNNKLEDFRNGFRSPTTRPVNQDVAIHGNKGKIGK